MPAAAPPTGTVVATMLAALGERIRARRKALRISAVAAAEAAGMSRVTLTRIERGEPSVAMGTYLSAIHALGLQLDLTVQGDKQSASAVIELPKTIALAQYPQLKRLAWQLNGVEELPAEQAFAMYERNWRHIDPNSLDPQERSLVAALAARYGGGRLLV